MSDLNYHLGIESSHLATSIALARNHEIIQSIQLTPEQNQRSRLLVSIIKNVLSEADLKPRDLTHIHVSLGPGSFTGLRIGLMIAKTLSYALNINLKGVPTFQTLADQVPLHSEINSLYIISDAQRGDVFIQQFNLTDHQWLPQSEISLLPFQQLLETTNSPTLISGPALHRFKLQDSTTLIPTPDSTWLPTASQTILTGQKLLLTSLPDNPIQLVPIYIRPSAAEEKKSKPA